MDRLLSNLLIDEPRLSVGEFLPGPERRRGWSAEEKARIVGESFEPEAVTSEVARRHGVHRNQLYAWRRQLRGAEPAGEVTFAPAITVPVVASAAMEIAYAGAVVRVGRDADPAVLARVLQTLKRLG